MRVYEQRCEPADGQGWVLGEVPPTQTISLGTKVQCGNCTDIGSVRLQRIAIRKLDGYLRLDEKLGFSTPQIAEGTCRR